MKTRKKSPRGRKLGHVNQHLVLLQVDPDTGNTRMWPSMIAAARGVEVKGRGCADSTERTRQVQISACASGIRNLSLGYLWVWVDASHGVDPSILKVHVDYALALRYLQTLRWVEQDKEKVTKLAAVIRSELEGE